MGALSDISRTSSSARGMYQRRGLPGIDQNPELRPSKTGGFSDQGHIRAARRARRLLLQTPERKGGSWMYYGYGIGGLLVLILLILLLTGRI